MSSIAAYTIPVKGLGEGIHRFEFKADGVLFKMFGAQEVKDGSADVEIEVNRKQAVAELEVTIKGSVVVECDRCLDDLVLPVDYSGVLVVRFSDRAADYDGETMWISPSEQSVSVGQYVYESIILSLPDRRVHPEGLCNPDMLSRFRAAAPEEPDQAEEMRG